MNAHFAPQQQQLQHLPNVMTGVDTQGLEMNQDVNVNLQYCSSNQTGSGCHQGTGPTSHSEQHMHVEANNIQSQNPFQSTNGGSYQESHPHAQTSQSTEQVLAFKNSQQKLQLSTANSNEAVMQPGAEFMLESGQTHTKADEPNHSFVTKCYGSSIVILDDDNVSQSRIPTDIQGMINVPHFLCNL